MKKLYYFDLGLFDGKEIDMFLNDISGLNINYEVHGFEAHPDYSERISSRFVDNKNVHIHNLAISDKEDIVNLYIEKTGHGNSIYPTKNNIDINNFVKTKSISFVDWIKDNISDFKNSYNILRFNIEGAELALFKQLEESGFIKYFNIFLGSTDQDILKVDELKEYYKYYTDLLERNDIKIHPYCYTLNCNISLNKVVSKLYE